MVCSGPSTTSFPVSMRDPGNEVGPGKPGKSFNFIVKFFRTGKCWEKATGLVKFWKSVELKLKI